jgi:hypothetical protein
VAALSDGSTHEVETDPATWTFSAPTEMTLAAATLWRAGDADGGWATNATYESWFAGPEDKDLEADVIDQCVAEFGCPTGVGDISSIRSPSNVVTVLPGNLGAHLYVNVSCAGSPKFVCPSGKGDPNGYAAVVYLYAADLILEQSSQPTVTNVEGELASASTLSGTADLSFHAEDPGSGVYQAVFTVDGAEAGRTLLDDNGGRCHDVGQTSDGLPAFLYLQPCLPSLSADVPFDTTTLSDGAHHLVVTVTDAAGNSTVALDRKIMVSNHPVSPSSPQEPPRESITPKEPTSPPQSPAPQQPSPEGHGPAVTTENDPSSSSNPASQLQGANGTQAPMLQVHWDATAKASLAGAYGHAQTVLGRLTAPSGQPIVGALIQVLSTPSFEGAKTVVLASVRTGADGSFRVRLPASTPSTRLTFAYSSHLAQAAPDAVATLALTISAHLSLDISPRTSHVGGVIRFSGALMGSPLPPGGKQLVLEARTPDTSWRQFQVLSTAARGRYRSSYRFRLGGPIVYEFRAVCSREADFPYATGSSNVVRVRER